MAHESYIIIAHPTPLTSPPKGSRELYQPCLYICAFPLPAYSQRLRYASGHHQLSGRFAQAAWEMAFDEPLSAIGKAQSDCRIGCKFLRRVGRAATVRRHKFSAATMLQGRFVSERHARHGHILKTAFFTPQQQQYSQQAGLIELAGSGILSTQGSASPGRHYVYTAHPLHSRKLTQDCLKPDRRRSKFIRSDPRDCWLQAAPHRHFPAAQRHIRRQQRLAPPTE